MAVSVVPPSPAVVWRSSVQHVRVQGRAAGGTRVEWGVAVVGPFSKF
jgi:hypothetical protein